MRLSSSNRRSGFTLVELLIVIAIIGVLVSISVPAIFFAVRSSRLRTIKMEVAGIETSINQYNQKYQDFPPDHYLSTNPNLLVRHLRKIFPQIVATEFTALDAATGSAIAGFPELDAAEAVVFFLGGFSDDPQHPLTGPGGPIVVVDATTNPWTVQYNTERNNGLYDFELSRLTIDQGSGLTLSNDEVIFAGATVGDAIPVYLPKGLNTPIVYFDSRTYGFATPGGYAFNKYYGPGLNGVARPYKSTLRNTNVQTYTNAQTYDRFYKYQNDKTFQLVTAGLDDNFGGILGGTGTYSSEILFKFPTGEADHPDAAVAGAHPKYDGAANLNAQFDNITNFSDTTLEDGLAN